MLGLGSLVSAAHLQYMQRTLKTGSSRALDVGHQIVIMHSTYTYQVAFYGIVAKLDVIYPLVPSLEFIPPGFENNIPNSGV